MGQVRHDHHLVTRVGAVIRRFKIDELPQLLNVLAGDMTLIGPRPTIREQVERYDAWQRRRLDARPGLSGWAQVNGNTELSWEERIALDVWYIDHWSPWLDLKILARTLGVVARGEQRNAAAVAAGEAHAKRAAGLR
jgi:lipopolysaccharide/colanic/teichoic acid biosynthesis glycosyltransferase